MASVLIVEDEESIRKMLSTGLSQAGLEVIEASNGEAAMTMAREKKPGVILLDVIMPRMHGIEMLGKLQAEEWGRRIPVILLTNYADDPRVVKVVQEGRCGLLKKEECRIEDIVQRVKEKLGST